jgi:hypothetical protein
MRSPNTGTQQACRALSDRQDRVIEKSEAATASLLMSALYPSTYGRLGSVASCAAEMYQRRPALVAAPSNTSSPIRAAHPRPQAARVFIL